MENIINEQLLSKVLKIEIISYEMKQKNIIGYEYNKLSKNEWSGKKFCNRSINIYELAHKCKKWAILNHYDFTILIDTIVIYYEGIKVHTIYNTLKGDNFIPFDPTYEIKACQWILENEDKDD